MQRYGRMNEQYYGSRYNELKTQKFVYKLIAAILVINTVVFLIVGYVMSELSKRNTEKYADADSVNATVVEVQEVYGSDDDKNYDIYVSYELDGKFYESVKLEGTMNASRIREGDTILVYVPVSDRNTASMMKDSMVFDILSVVFYIVGGASFAGLVVILMLLTRSKKKSVNGYGN